MPVSKSHVKILQIRRDRREAGKGHAAQRRKGRPDVAGAVLSVDCRDERAASPRVLVRVPHINLGLLHVRRSSAG